MAGISELDAYALKRALAQMDVPEGLCTSPLLQTVLKLHNPKTPEGWAKLSELVNANPDIQQAVLRIDPKAPPPSNKAEIEIHVPDLPSNAQLSPEAVKATESVGKWLTDYMRWITARSPMTPKLMLEAGGLYCIGLTVARRMELRLDFDSIYPHLYVLWVAPTSYFRKSTGLKAITQLIRETTPHLLLAAQNTPELLLSKMAGQYTSNFNTLSAYQQKLETLGRKFAGQRGIVTDEATKLFLGKKYLEGLAEFFMELYDAPEVIDRELKAEGKLIVEEPAASVLGATTPARLARNVSDLEWEDGLLARFALLTPTEAEVKRPKTTGNQYPLEVPSGLKSRLAILDSALPEPPDRFSQADDNSKPPTMDKRAIEIDPQALDAFNAYADAMQEMTAPHFGLDERLRGNYSRFPVMILKLAMCLCAMDWADNNLAGKPTITFLHWAKSQLIVESWRESAHRLLAQLTRSLDMVAEEKVLEYIAAYSDRKPTEREIHTATRIHNRKDVKAAIEALIQDGQILEVERLNQRGPSTKGYILAE